jgi:hypothetical protein
VTPSDSPPLVGRLFTRDQVVHDLLPRLLETAVCSAPWLSTLFEPVVREGQVLYRYRQGAYPPGGKASRMRRCPTCGRTCPPNGLAGTPCCDCQIEVEQEAFHVRIRKPPARDISTDLQRRWWPLGITYVEFIASPTSEMILTQYGQSQFIPAETNGEEGSAFDFSEWSEGPLAPEDRPRKSSLGDYRTALAIALRRLNPLKKERGRHPGCQIVLLPEEPDALEREIAYYRRTDRIVPSALRISHPYRPDPPESRELLPQDDPGD